MEETDISEAKTIGPVAHWPINFPASCNDENQVGWITDQIAGANGSWSPTGTGDAGCVLIQGPGARSYLRLQNLGATIFDSPQLNFKRAMSIAVLINAESTAGEQTVLGKWAEPDAYALSVRDGEYVFTLGFEGGVWGRIEELTAPANAAPAWTRLVATYDGSAMRLYADGTLLAERPTKGKLQQSARPLVIGAHPAQFRGGIDDVRLYNYALSTEEIAALPLR